MYKSTESKGIADYHDCLNEGEVIINAQRNLQEPLHFYIKNKKIIIPPPTNKIIIIKKNEHSYTETAF